MSTAEALQVTGEKLTDEEIAARVAAGDTALFEVLMRRHNQRVYRTVRAILGGEEDIEDVMQQAYINAYRSLKHFEARSLFSTWLTRIAVNEALARRKKTSRHLEIVPAEETMFEVESSGPDPEQQALSSQLRNVLEREVSALPATLRAAFVLRDVEGLSTQEAAAALSVSEDVVKTRLHRARTTLRKNLERRAGLTLETLFPFGNERCDRVVAAVMAELGK